MKHARIFIASSEELAQERIIIGDIVCRIEKYFVEEGYILELLEWEDFDSAYNGKRKQDEYNEVIQSSDLFIGLFWRRAGGYTLEEYEVAKSSLASSFRPKIHIFIKDIHNGETRDVDLHYFIENTLKRENVQPVYFSDINSLKLAFVQCTLESFPLKEFSLVESEGIIRLGTVKICAAQI